MPEDAAAVAAAAHGSGADTQSHTDKQQDTGIVSARVHAIAKLRRAASAREVRHAVPRSSPATVGLVEAAPNTETSPKNSSDAPPTPALPPAPTEGPAVLLPSPLPSLEQLRQRILRERKPTGLSRSASTSATSQVARAYTLQKLLGSTTPLPYHDMFAFVRSVNQASSSNDAASPPTSPCRAPPTIEADSPTQNSQRATLLRSVSARDGVRARMVRRLGRHDTSDTPPRATMSAASRANASSFSDDSSSATAHESTGSSGWRVSLYNYDASVSPHQTSIGTAAPSRSGTATPRESVLSSAPATPHRTSLELTQSSRLAQRESSPSPRAAPVLHEAHMAMDWRTTERGGLASPPLYQPSPGPPSTARLADSSLDGVRAASSPVRHQKPLPRLPPSSGGVRPLRDSVSGDTLPLARRPQAPPLPLPHMLPSMLARSASVGGGSHMSGDEDERKEARVARLWGSLRRKTSMRSLRRPTGPASTGSGHSARAWVALLTQTAEASLSDPVVTLPVTPAMLMQWNQTLVRPVRHLLSHFPASVPHDVSLDPPRRLVSVLPLLQAAGDEYVKLRYAFLFQDVLVLARPPLVVQGDESIPDVMLRKLSHVPALSEACLPFAVLDLAQVRVERCGEPSEGELSALWAPHLPTLTTHLNATLEKLVRETGLVRDESDAAAYAAAQARLLYACEPLDRRALWQFLQTHPRVLAPFVAQYRMRGVPLDVALRHLLLDIPRPETAASMEALLLAFAVHWHASNVREWPAHTLESVTDLTWALVALHDALHEPSGHWAAYDPNLSLNDFVVGFRAHGAAQAVSDRELGEMYLSLRTSPLASGGAECARTISIDAHAWHALGALGVPSAPVRVRIDAPDPDLQVRLLGVGLLADPPVLSFAHSAHAQFTLCAATPGPHDLVFVRLGRHASLYGGHAPAPGMAALPRSLQVRVGRAAPASRTTLSLVPLSPGAGPSHTFYLTDAPSAQRITSLLQSTVDAAHAHARRLAPSEWDVRALPRANHTR
ncbi:hypothetical protein MNAN1_000812 [Malassezia nana]|uniref:SEC7 domain-containing protein n=1 Tax=Malassezia nana TaxID=180528 RepID=A0AAF0EHH1_9BASI|nr:hypothetical protein MNAN1_000812 [Malassezia nana]